MKYVYGDLLESNCSHIIHGCNAQRVMNAGIAKAIRTKWPGVWKDYSSAPDDIMQPGNIIWTAPNNGDENPYRIISAITQKYYGRDTARRYVSYDAIDKCLRGAAFGIDMSHSSNSTIAMPMIGAGLGGGDWGVISSIIKSVEEDFNIEFNIYINDLDVYLNVIGKYS